ncbi:MAG: ABC transporter ATP-binding protein [Roseiflexaceae bacterium]
MGFVLDGLRAEHYDRSYSDAALVRRIGSYFRPHTRRLAIVVAMVVLTSIAGTIIPLTISYGVDLFAGQPSLQLLLMAAGAATVLGLLNWCFNYVQQSVSAQAVADVVRAVQRDAFNATLRHDMAFFDSTMSGRIVSRVTSDTQSFANVVTLTVNLLSQVLMVVLIAAALVLVEPSLAAATLAMAPVVILVALGFRAIARWTARNGQRATAEVNSTIQETISGIGVAKNFRQEGAIYADFQQTNRQAYRNRLRQGLVFNTIFPTLDLLAAIGTAVVIYYGGLLATQGQISLGSWYLFVQSLALFYFPLTSIASFWSQFQQGLSASERIFALIDDQPRVVQTDAQPVPQVRGRISFRHVSFAYRAGEPVLPDLSLEIPAGQRLAIVGHTGAGKSSLVRLIARFYEFQGGELLIDGRDVRELDLAAYRRHVGIVPQSPFLFSGTIADNIRYGVPGADDATVQQIAEQIGGGEWLRALPNGLQTKVGERGAQISLGQRQLVALCRVLLHNPSIFILDEATASVDPFTEAQIQAALDVVMRGRTSILIAHRLSTVETADRIIVLDQGTVVEDGSHEQLLALGHHYAELYNTYFRHQSLDYIEHAGYLQK